MVEPQGQRERVEGEVALEGVEEGVECKWVVTPIRLAGDRCVEIQHIHPGLVLDAVSGVRELRPVGVLEIQQVGEGSDGVVVGRVRSRAEEVRVAVPVTRLDTIIGPEDAVDVVQVRVFPRDGLARALDANRVVGLFVLAKGDPADHPLRAVDDALPAGRHRQRPACVLDEGLVQIEALGVGDHRVLGAPVGGGVEAVEAEDKRVVRFHPQRHRACRGRVPRHAGTRRGRLRILAEIGLVDLFEPVAETQRCLAVGDGLAQVHRRRLGRRGEHSQDHEDGNGVTGHGNRLLRTNVHGFSRRPSGPLLPVL